MLHHPKLLAKDYVIDYNLDQKCQAYTALQDVKAGKEITPVDSSVKMDIGWDKVIEAQIEKGHEALIEPSTLKAYQTYIDAPELGAEPVAVAQATL